MPKTNLVPATLVLVVFACAHAIFPAILTVAKSGADFSTISAAIRAAAPGDVIKIMDTETYEEQVTIDSTKYPLTLMSKDPTWLTKPTIKYRDTIDVGPRTYAESQVDSMITYDKNGALRIIKAHQVIIDGIAIDGGGVYPFGYPGIWDNRDPLQHGNAAIVLYQSSDVIIRNCTIASAYFGIYSKDRNRGGIFVNPNPEYIDTLNNIPLAGFGLTGNHLVERNRIHHNSWSMFFESSWDVGSTIRYNLLYENHHPSTGIATKVNDLTSEGHNQAGGAFLFKDVPLSPCAIYNNTLWHNFILFAGHWQAGYQHLIFNNIYGTPHKYWDGSTPGFNTTAMELTPALRNRVYNCIYSAQVAPPREDLVRIMNNMPQLEKPLPVPGMIWAEADLGGGTMIGFPAAANNRWLEMDSSMFISTNPESAGFLEPKWSDTNVQKYIRQQGWQGSGVKNTDGTWADLGAIEQAHGTPSFIGTIEPTPVPITQLTSGSGYQITFTVDAREGTTMADPTIKLFRLVNLQYKKDTFGSDGKSIVIGTDDMIDLPPPTLPPVKVGPNTYTISTNITSDFAFIEMIIEATGADGKKFTTAAGFIPFRTPGNQFKVQVFDQTGQTELKETRVGDTVQLRLTPLKMHDTVFTNPINKVQVTLLSGFMLMDASKNPLAKLEYPNGIPGGPDNKLVVFTKIPESGIENITAAGLWKNPETGKYLPFIGGTSIKILIGPPEIVIFQNPYSNRYGLLPPTLPVENAYPCTLWVYDKYGNRVTSPAQVVVQSKTPNIANVIGGHPDTTITTDASGVGTFFVKTENAATAGAIVWLQGNVVDKTVADSAMMVVSNYLAISGNPFLQKDAVRQPSHEVTIKCFDLQGRRIFQKTFLSDMGLAFMPRYLQNNITGIAKKVYLMDISVKDRISLKTTRSIQKIVVR